MSWAARRRLLYLCGVLVFFGIVVGIPVAILTYHAPTCVDGIQNQGETSPDHGGPCPLLDENLLSPYAVLWTRSFLVRDGIYNAVAYIQNPNPGAGVMQAAYHFSFYDSQNILVAEKKGVAFIMPESVTPVFAGNVQSGNRQITHAYFELQKPLTWQKLKNTANVVTVMNREMDDQATSPRLSAVVHNNSVDSLQDVTFVAVLFDPAGNAFAGSQTALPRIEPGQNQTIVFTWPLPLQTKVGHIDIIPVARPVPPRS